MDKGRSNRLGRIRTAHHAGRGHALLATTGMCLFNMTMAVTLVAVALMPPGRPGFAFGAPCLALFLGMLPTATEVRWTLADSRLLLPIVLFLPACSTWHFAPWGGSGTWHRFRDRTDRRRASYGCAFERVRKPLPPDPHPQKLLEYGLVAMIIEGQHH